MHQLVPCSFTSCVSVHLVRCIPIRYAARHPQFTAESFTPVHICTESGTVLFPNERIGEKCTEGESVIVELLGTFNRDFTAGISQTEPSLVLICIDKPRKQSPWKVPPPPATHIETEARTHVSPLTQIYICSGPNIGINDPTFTREKTLWELYAYSPQHDYVDVILRFDKYWLSFCHS